MRAHKRTLFGLICLALVMVIIPAALTGATSDAPPAHQPVPAAQIDDGGNATALPEGVSGDWFYCGRRSSELYNQWLGSRRYKAIAGSDKLYCRSFIQRPIQSFWLV